MCKVECRAFEPYLSVCLCVCNGVPPLHDLHKVNIKYEYSVKTNRIFSQYWLNKQYSVAEVIHYSLVDID